MADEHNLDAVTTRKSLRPVLLAPRTGVVEYSSFLRHLLIGLADESIPTGLVCPPGCDSESVVPVPATVLVHPLVDLPLMEHFGIERLAGQLEKLKPTILHSLSEGVGPLARQLARRLNLPYVQTLHTLVKRSCRASMLSPHCTAVVAPAETILANAVRWCPQLADRITQINVGTFIEEDTVCFPDPSRLPSIIVARPLDRVADFANFLEAVKALLSDGYEFMVILMGSGRAEHRLRRFLAHRGLSESVTIVPVLHPWRSVLAAADIFVQPRPLRTFSVFLLEAMSLGTAVAACTGGVDDLIIPNQTAVIFDPDDRQSIQQALVRLLGDHDFARRLAGIAQEHVKARHSVSAMISATLDLYAEAQQRFGG